MSSKPKLCLSSNVIQHTNPAATSLLYYFGFPEMFYSYQVSTQIYCWDPWRCLSTCGISMTKWAALGNPSVLARPKFYGLKYMEPFPFFSSLWILHFNRLYILWSERKEDSKRSAKDVTQNTKVRMEALWAAERQFRIPLRWFLSNTTYLCKLGWAKSCNR